MEFQGLTHFKFASGNKANHSLFSNQNVSLKTMCVLSNELPPRRILLCWPSVCVPARIHEGRTLENLGTEESETPLSNASPGGRGGGGVLM